MKLQKNFIGAMVGFCLTSGLSFHVVWPMSASIPYDKIESTRETAFMKLAKISVFALALIKRVPCQLKNINYDWLLAKLDEMFITLIQKHGGSVDYPLTALDAALFGLIEMRVNAGAYVCSELNEEIILLLVQRESSEFCNPSAINMHAKQIQIILMTTGVENFQGEWWQLLEDLRVWDNDLFETLKDIQWYLCLNDGDFNGYYMLLQAWFCNNQNRPSEKSQDIIDH